MNEVVYLMIETQSSSEGPGSADFISTAIHLAERGHNVSLWLLQNGVLHLLDTDLSFWRSIKRAPTLSLYADDFSLVQRSIGSEWIDSAGARVAGMSRLAAELMRPGCKVIWH